jgi:hypothetical protein
MGKSGPIVDEAQLAKLAKAREKANEIRRQKAEEKKDIKLASEIEHKQKLAEAQDLLKASLVSPSAGQEKIKKITVKKEVENQVKDYDSNEIRGSAKYTNKKEEVSSEDDDESSSSSEEEEKVVVVKKKKKTNTKPVAIPQRSTTPALNEPQRQPTRPPLTKQQRDLYVKYKSLFGN